MSGAEAVAVISLIASIITLTDFTCGIISRTKEYGENTHDVPKAFRDIETLLPLFSNTLTQTRDRIRSGILDDDICRNLRPVLKGCEDKIKQLELIFKDVMVQEGASKVKRGWLAIKSIQKEKEVKEIAQALHNSVAYLTHYHASEAATRKDMDSLKLALSSMSVEQPETQPSKTHFLVPVQWTHDFAGREEVMTELDSRLCLEDQYSRVALVGLGGMGKTRIALEYAKKFKSSNKVSVFWVYAGTVERFKNAYRDIARKLKIPVHQSPDNEILNAVKDYLQDDRTGQWLMILDNADDAEIMYASGSLRLVDYLPRSNKGSILLTTRFQHVGASFTSARNVLSLQNMTLEESELLLRARLDDRASEQNRQLYQELAEELERTPLALVQAASYMYKNSISADTYLQMYRESDTSKIGLLSEDFEDDIRDHQAKNPIATTWIISFDYISTHVPHAAELLSLMSVVDGQNIPDFLIPQSKDAKSFNEAIGTLKAFSFISIRTQIPGCLQSHRLFDLHRLVRLAIRNWLKLNNTLDLRTAQMLQVVTSWRVGNRSAKFETLSLIFPHAIEILTSDLLQCRCSSKYPYELEIQDGLSLTNLQFSSKRTSSQALEAIHRLENVNTVPKLMIQTALLMGEVISNLLDVENFAEARNFATKSVAIKTRIIGQSHQTTLLSKSTLAIILQRMGESEHAEHLGRQNVAMCEAEYGTQHIHTLICLMELLSFLHAGNHQQEARKIYNIVIQRWQESLLVHEGDDYLEISRNLAKVHLYNNDFEEAERCAMRALHGYQAANDDGGVITALNSLIDIYQTQGKFGLAGDVKKAELDACIRFFGQKHQRTMASRYRFIIILLRNKKEKEARRQASLTLDHISQFYNSSSDTYAFWYGKFEELFPNIGEKDECTDA